VVGWAMVVAVRVRAETEMARAEVETARAEAETARAEEETARAEAATESLGPTHGRPGAA
jgi:hypothetical protein